MLAAPPTRRRPRRRPHCAAVAAATLVLAAVMAGRAHAEEPAPERITDLIDFRSGSVEADPQLRELTLRRDVVVTYGRYRIESDALHLALTPGGILVEGEGEVAFCPCADPPITIQFSGGRVAPPGDLLVAYPRLRVLGVPVFALPYLWLRSPERVGLLPPRMAWRGEDGLLAGAGVHLPWRSGDGATRFLDVRGAGYLQGGAETSVRLETPRTTTFALVDEIDGTRAVLDARGSLELGDASEPTLAWDADAVRGERGRRGTVELAPAAQRHDHAAAETALRLDGGRANGLVAAAVRARGGRGDGALVAGPQGTLALGGGVAGAGVWDGDVRALALGDGGGGTTSVVVAGSGVELYARPGPLDVRLALRGRGRLAERRPDLPDVGAPAAGAGAGGTSRDAVGAARVEVGLPLARSWERGSGAAPLVHTIGPVAEARAAVAAREGGDFLAVERAALPAWSWLAAGGAATAIGRWTGSALRLEARAGAIGEEGQRPLLLAHGRLLATAPALRTSIEGALVGSDAAAFRIDDGGPSDGRAAGAALIGALRLGQELGPSIGVDAAGQSGSGAGRARAVAGGTAAALPGEDLDWLAGGGWSGGAEAAVPLSRSVRALARADADLGQAELVALRGGATYRHPCGCVAAELFAQHRLGRDGVDIWLGVDLAPP
jgi:hypothetical protein